MNRSRWMTLAIVAVVLLGGGWWLKSRGKSGAPQYRTAAVERGDISATVSATGTVKPVVQVAVGSQVSGTLQKLFVDYNSRVKAGQILCELEPSIFRARAAQAEATVAHAEAALKDGERQLARSKELIKQDFISQADVDAAQSTLDQRKADLKQARASLDAARVDLGHTIIRSPIDGVVIARSIDVGQTVAASLQAPQLFVIANDLKQMQVETKIDEADIGRIHIGLPVTFNVDAFPDDNFEGSVSQVRLEPITDQNVTTYTTVIATRNESLKLRPGMTANVTVLVEKRTGVLKVANAALRFRPEGAGGRGGPGSRGGAPGGGGGAPGAGVRRGFAMLMEKLVPSAFAQGRPEGGAPDSSRHRMRGQGGAGMRGSWSGGGTRSAPGAMGTSPGEAAPTGTRTSPLKRGAVWVLKSGKPSRVAVMTGISDGSMTEIVTDELKEGDLVIVGMEVAATNRGTNLQPPPGMGGPQFRGPGGGGGRR